MSYSNHLRFLTAFRRAYQSIGVKEEAKADARMIAPDRDEADMRKIQGDILGLVLCSLSCPLVSEFCVAPTAYATSVYGAISFCTTGIAAACCHIAISVVMIRTSVARDISV